MGTLTDYFSKNLRFTHTSLSVVLSSSLDVMLFKWLGPQPPKPNLNDKSTGYVHTSPDSLALQ